ncbi:oligosaccharyl transferase, archaeosortase A system-associated [Chloroflexota bacterium]
MKALKINPLVYIGILIALFFGVSLLLRVYLPYDKIFSDVGIKFSSIDAYYQMRLVDSLAHNFPDFLSFDPFFIYPGGNSVNGPHFFTWLQSGIIWLIGLGSPTQHTIDVVGVLIPPVLAAMTVIPVYFIGKALFNRWAGVLAAGLVAVLPGEFIGRSILGFNDTPAIEILLTATSMAFLILAVKTAGQRHLTLGHLIKHDSKIIVRPIVYSALAGIFLGFYLISWPGALLFAFIVSLYIILQFIINHLKLTSSEHLGIVGVIFFLLASIIFIPFSLSRDLSMAMIIAILIPLGLYALSRLMTERKFKPLYYPLTIVGIGIILIALIRIIDPGTLSVMIAKFRMVFDPSGATATTTLEMQPFLSPQGSFSTLVAWGNFTTSFFLTKNWPIPGFALISLSYLIYLFIRQPGNKPEWQRPLMWTCGILITIMAMLILLSNLEYRYFAIIPLVIFIGIFLKQRSDDEHWLVFFVWTLVILIATMAQRRFAYYLVVNIAVLSGYFSWQVIWLAGLRKLLSKPEQATEDLKGRKAETRITQKNRVKEGINIFHINVVLAIIVIFFFVFFLNIQGSKSVASAVSFAPSDAWQSSLTWMKNNTPEPLGDADAYYKFQEAPPGGNYEYPESAYGVTSWWDYGYWISRIAHRLPSANPSQDPTVLTKTAKLFLSLDDSEAQMIMDEMKSSYIVTDYATSTSKFWAVLTWAEKTDETFIGVFHMPYEGQLVPVQLFNPEYYQSLIVRLYNFDGKAVSEGSPTVISYDEMVDEKGTQYKQISDIEDFSSYQEALDYIKSHDSSKHAIVGINPFISPIPLEAVPDFELVYSSATGVSNQDAGMIPEVKIFEYNR